MELSNFSSLIEVGVTLNIACVAIEYAKSYTSTLCNQVFNLKSQIANSCKECEESLTDETTISNLPNANLNGANTDILKDRLKSKRNTLISDIAKKKKELEEKIKEVCEVKNISSICLWLSMLGLTGLFLIGFEDTTEGAENPGIHLYWTILTLFSVIFTVLGWKRGDKEKPLWKVIDYCSLRFSLFTFLICSALSTTVYFLIIGAEFVSYIERWWSAILVFSMFLIYSNFVASSIEVWNKAKRGQNEIIKEKGELMKRCEEINSQVNSLQGVGNVAAMLTTDTATE